MREHEHYWSNWHYHHNSGGEFENHWRECANPHWPEQSCGVIQKLFVKEGQTELLAEISTAIEPVLSGQYGREVSDDVAMEILFILQERQNEN